MGIEKWDLVHMHWDTIHQARGAKPASEVIGYEYNDERHHISYFVCADHEEPGYFKKWTPVTVRDTQGSYYQCDRMGCELGYYQEWIQVEENNDERKRERREHESARTHSFRGWPRPHDFLY